MQHINEPPPRRARERGRTSRCGSTRRVAARAGEGPGRPLRLDGRVRGASSRHASPSSREPDAERTFIAPSPVLQQSRPHRRAGASPPLADLPGARRPARRGGDRRRGPRLGGSKGNSAAQAQPAAAASVHARGGRGLTTRTAAAGEHDAEASEGDRRRPGDLLADRELQILGVRRPEGRRRARRRRRPARRSSTQLTVATDTPGFTAQIQAGSAAYGPFAADSSAKDRQRHDDVHVERNARPATTCLDHAPAARAAGRT